MIMVAFYLREERINYSKELLEQLIIHLKSK